MLISRREMLRNAVAAIAALAVPIPLAGCRVAPGETDPDAVPNIARTDQPVFDAPNPEDAARFSSWVQTLEAYLRAGGSPMRSEPLTLTLTRFDCVSLVESCIAVARVARTEGEPTWDRFAREMERMRYRGGIRAGYTSRLHYFSEWLADGERRQLVQDIGQRLGARPDSRPLRFMSEHPDSYPALAERSVLEEVAEIECSLDRTPRLVIPTTSIPDADSSIQTGDILAFATSIEGLDVTHAAFAYRDSNDVLRVLHAPLSGGVVEVTRATLPQYVAGIKRSTGIIVARPLG
jgi:hypothetical protein